MKTRRATSRSTLFSAIRPTVSRMSRTLIAQGQPGSEPFRSPVLDYYLTNPIARASRVLAECSGDLLDPGEVRVVGVERLAQGRERIEGQPLGQYGLGGQPGSEPFRSPVLDYYLTNPIARASRVLAEPAKCGWSA
jgi:hypothetical protein